MRSAGRTEPRRRPAGKRQPRSTLQCSSHVSSGQWPSASASRAARSPQARPNSAPRTTHQARHAGVDRRPRLDPCRRPAPGEARLQGRIRHGGQLSAVLGSCRRLAQRLRRGLAQQCRRHLSQGAGSQADRKYRTAETRDQGGLDLSQTHGTAMSRSARLDSTAETRMPAGAGDTGNRAQGPLSRLSGGLGLTRRNHHRRQRPATCRDPVGLGRRAGGGTRFRDRCQEAPP